MKETFELNDDVRNKLNAAVAEMLQAASTINNVQGATAVASFSLPQPKPELA